MSYLRFLVKDTFRTDRQTEIIIGFGSSPRTSDKPRLTRSALPHATGHVPLPLRASQNQQPKQNPILHPHSPGPLLVDQKKVHYEGADRKREYYNQFNANYEHRNFSEIISEANFA